MFAIASGSVTLICTDSTTSKSCFNRPFGHYVRILVDLDLYNELGYKILAERQSYDFLLKLNMRTCQISVLIVIVLVTTLTNSGKTRWKRKRMLLAQKLGRSMSKLSKMLVIKMLIWRQL